VQLMQVQVSPASSVDRAGKAFLLHLFFRLVFNSVVQRREWPEEQSNMIYV
jgi:hypothetical protein